MNLALKAPSPLASPSHPGEEMSSHHPLSYPWAQSRTCSEGASGLARRKGTLGGWAGSWESHILIPDRPLFSCEPTTQPPEDLVQISPPPFQNLPDPPGFPSHHTQPRSQIRCPEALHGLGPFSLWIISISVLCSHQAKSCEGRAPSLASFLLVC